MAASLAFMLPAMNVDDRAELLGGMRADAPAEVFSGVVSLARSVLEPAGVHRHRQAPRPGLTRAGSAGDIGGLKEWRDGR